MILILYLPNVISMRKNIIAQKTEPVIVAIASGYTIKINPGPEKSELSTFANLNC